MKRTIASSDSRRTSATFKKDNFKTMNSKDLADNFSPMGLLSSAGSRTPNSTAIAY